MKKTSFLIAIMFFSLGYLSVPAQPVIPDRLHTVPVSISRPMEGISVHGTGLYINESNHTYFITAAHCIFNIQSTNFNELLCSNILLTSFTQNGGDTDKMQLFVDLPALFQNGKIKRHPNHDIAVLQVAHNPPFDKTDTSSNFYAIGTRILSNPSLVGITMTTDKSLRTYNNVSDGDEAFILGYPAELLRGQMAWEVDFDYPLIRKGIIAQKNQKTTKFIIDSGVFGGNSGGPVFIMRHPQPNVDNYDLVGIVTQFVGSATREAPQAGITNSVILNSGYTVAEPIDFALELMRQF